MKKKIMMFIAFLILTQVDAQTLKQSNEPQDYLLKSELETLSKTELVETIIEIEKIYLEELDDAIDQAYNKGFDLAIKQVGDINQELFVWKLITCAVSVLAGASITWGFLK